LIDRVGNVEDHYFDEGHRLVMKRRYHAARNGSGYSETRRVWDSNSQLAYHKAPNGDAVLSKADGTNADPRARGNVLMRQQWRSPYDPAPLTERFDYLQGLGGCCGGGGGSNFVKWYKDARSNVTSNGFDERGNLIHTQYPIASIVEDWEYNSNGQMTAHVLPENGSGYRRRDEYTYHDTGPQQGYLHEQIIDAGNLGLTTAYAYNSVGSLTGLTDARGNDTQYLVNQLGQIIREICRAVGGVRYERDTYHDENNNVVRRDVQNIDDQGSVVASNPQITTTYEYDTLNRLTRTNEEVAADHDVATEYEYDHNGNRTLVRHGEAVNGNDPNNVVQTEYDERDLVSRTIRGDGAGQSITQYDYDDNRKLIRRTDGAESADPHVYTYEYDELNRLASVIDPEGNVTTSGYDDNGNRTLGRIEGELIDGESGDNVQLSETTYEYDAMNRLIRQVTALFDPASQNRNGDGQSITQTFYSGTSQVIRVVDDNNHETLISHDTANRTATVTDAKGNTTSYTYDDNSNVTTVTEVEKSDRGDSDDTFVTSNGYDALDRLTRTIDNAGSAHASGYDSRNNRTVATDPLNRETRYVYDGLSRLTKTVRDMNSNGADASDSDDIITSQTWDDSSRLTSQADDNGNATTYAYDALNRRTSETFADGTEHSRTYDVHDNVRTTTDANGTVVSYTTYDQLNRLKRKDVSQSGPGVSDDTTFEDYKYDGLDRLVYAADDDSTVTRAYDSVGNVLSETLTNNADGVQTAGAVASTYDGVGNRTTCVYPSGRALTTTYDELNRRKIISDGGGDIASNGYVGPGRVERRRYRGNNTSTDYAYDNVKRIVGTTHSRLVNGDVDDRTYAWNAMYNKTRRTDVRAGGPRLTHEYDYDEAYRLVHTRVTNAILVVLRDTHYNLDGVHNRTTVVGAPDAGPHVGSYAMTDGPPPFDHEANQYTTTPVSGRTYDPNGNLLSVGLGDVSAFAACVTGPGGGITTNGCVPFDFDFDVDIDLGDFDVFQRSYVSPVGRAARVGYDYRNRMVEYRDIVTGERHTYAYDAFGRRIARTIDADGAAVQTRYFYDAWQVVEEQDANSNSLATYVYGNYIDEVLSMQRGGVDYFYHTDDLYNVMAVTDATGAVVERYEYQDYGQPIDPVTLAPIAGDPSPIGNPYLFTGRRYDPETAWYYYRTRYLDPIAGRFTTRDTIGVWGDPLNLGNEYTYAGNNPVSYRDPYGLFTWPWEVDWTDPETYKGAASTVEASIDVASDYYVKKVPDCVWQYLSCVEDCMEDNDPVDSFIAKAIAYTAGMPIPKGVVAKLYEVVGDKGAARLARAGASKFTNIPSALSTKLRLGGRSALRALGRVATPVVVAYGTALAAIEVHCASYCVGKDKYDPANGKFGQAQIQKILDAIK
ncbi:MAG: RHS repeat protein, partial [bacterium]|nr:RHS repeat protein [bacterium]